VSLCPGPAPIRSRSMFGLDHSPTSNQAGESISEVSPVEVMSLRMQFGEQCLLVYTLAFLVGVNMRLLDASCLFVQWIDHVGINRNRSPNHTCM
jgi:hypothetical protein